MKFTKMHGIGNDYIYFNCLDTPIENPQELAITLSDRHFSIGGDGIVLICPSDKADAKMRMFNADGSEGKMCGNAIRCVGKYLYDNGLVQKKTLEIETLSGIKKLSLDVCDNKVAFVTVDMGEAVLTASQIPVLVKDSPVVDYKLTIGDASYRITCVSMGNPHCVVFMSGIESLPLEVIGPTFEHHPVFPERVNTEFIEVESSTSIKMRVWERGSGETFACGTGACAAVVACVLNGKCKQGEEITVHLRGGDLKITYQLNGTVLMCGSATFAFEGEVHV